MRPLLFYVLAVPLPPFLQLALFSNGSHLQAYWRRPFTMSGFPTTSYTLDVVNKTSGIRTKVILDQSLTETVIYDHPNPGILSSCHSLSFSVIASNSIGDSSTSNIVTSGFPICKQIRCLSGCMLQTYEPSLHMPGSVAMPLYSG